MPEPLVQTPIQERRAVPISILGIRAQPVTKEISPLLNLNRAVPIRIISPTTQRNQTQEIDAMLASFLRKSYEKSTKKFDEVRLPQEVGRIQSIIATMTAEQAKDFLNNKYVQENLVYFLDIDPKKISLALQVARRVDGLVQRNNYEPQFTPALNLGSYTVLEYLRDNGLTTLSANQAREFLRRRLLTYEQERVKTTKEKDIHIGERTLLHHTIDYLSQVGSNLSGEQLEAVLINVVSQNLHTLLDRTTAELREFNQPQGIEIEVLKYVVSSKRAKERRVDPKWLPRGIPMEKHARKDWNLLPLLGIKEDIGERAHQVYEMSTDPSETSALQGSLAYQMMISGFITEDMLGDIKEGYSLHISTIFPKDIINSQSLQDYRLFARVLAGAFASDQRIAFGGFMSGGDEVSDKSAAGTLKEVGKRKLPGDRPGLPQGVALLEIRNLDITPTGQYSALHAKNISDFAFRCYWENRLRPNMRQTPLESYAGSQWSLMMGDLRQLFAKYGITQDSMAYKYGKDWDAFMWQEMEQAREKNPQLKKEFADVLRTYESRIRTYKRNFESSKRATPLHSLDLRKRVNARAEIKRERSPQTRYLTMEPHGAGDNCIYLNKNQRDILDAQPGEPITIRMGTRVITVRTERARKRDDGTVDDLVSPYVRLSKNILTSLNIPKGMAVLPIYDKVNHEIRLNSPDVDTWPIVKFPVPHAIHTESKLAFNRFGLSSQEMGRLRLRDGDEINVRFGKMKKKVRVFATDRSDRSQAASAKGTEYGYICSPNLLSEFGLRDGIALRSRYDANEKLLDIGPHIALLRHIGINEQGMPVVYKAKGMAQELSRLAEEYGASLCIVDPNSQSQQVLVSGYVDAYIMDSQGNLERRRMPIPGVAYDKDNWWRKRIAHTTESMIDHYISPAELRGITGDKYAFAKLLENRGLGQFHPETVKINVTKEVAALQLEGLLQKYQRIFLKPRNGSNGSGIIRIDKVGSRYKFKYGFNDEQKKWVVVQKEASTIDEVLDETQKMRESGGQDYLAQQNIRFADYKYTENDTVYHRNPEIRLVIQRGINGRANITGMIAMLYSPEMQGRDIYKKGIDVISALRDQNAGQTIKQIRSLGFKVHNAIEETVGKSIGDLVVDIGIQTDGSLMILEANSVSTPKQYFEEAQDKDGEYGNASRPIEYALFLSGMN